MPMGRIEIILAAKGILIVEDRWSFRSIERSSRWRDGDEDRFLNERVTYVLAEYH